MCRAPFAVLICVLAAVEPLSAENRVATRLMPPQTVLYAEIPNPPELLSTIFDHPLRAKIEALEPYRQATRTDGYRAFLTGRRFVEIQLDMEWREALDTLTAHGIYLGVDAESQGLALLIHAKNAESLELFKNKLLEITRLGKNPDQIKQGEYRGIQAYQIDNTKFAIVDDWLLVTNKSETGEAVLDRLIDGAGECLADNPNFQAARGRRPDHLTGWGYADLQTLRTAGVAKKLFAGRAENPAVELLLGGIASSLQHTPFATVSLQASDAGLGVDFSMPHQADWVPEERTFYFGPEGSGRAPGVPQAVQTLFTLSTYRDVSEMWLRAGDLFDERINDGFAEADATLTTLFAGKDFAEDILGVLKPEISFIATRPDFTDVLPVPAIKVPQFALVLELKEPETMTRELRRTFQSMIGFFNVIGAMEGRPQLEMELDQLDSGAQLVTSTYIPEQDEADSTQAPILFNFSPSVGFAKERFVVSSTKQLARELVETPISERTDQPVNTNAILHADVLKMMLQDNREQLISQNMLQDGNGREEAEAAIGLLLEFVGYFQNASVQLNVQEDALSLKMDVRVKE